MEALYSKLYDKYNKLKARRLTELDELNKDQEVKFVNYVSAAEELINHLKNENDRLTSQVDDLRNEVASIRSSKDEQCAMYQKLLMEENEKNKSLSEEVDRLQKLYQLEPSCSSKDGKNDNSKLNTPQSAQVMPAKVFNESSRRMTRKRALHAVQSGIEAEVGAALPVDNTQDVVVRESVKDLSKANASGGISQQPECCQGTIDRSGGGAVDIASANCLFRDISEYLVGMKLSAANQTEGVCISALHQSSGYSFSLTWLNKAPGEESELLYRVSSLGTFERVAPEWMREALMFSTSMCPIFFERVARVIKLCH